MEDLSADDEIKLQLKSGIEDYHVSIDNSNHLTYVFIKVLGKYGIWFAPNKTYLTTKVGCFKSEGQLDGYG